MYLPDVLPNAEVLITVKTYPLPSNSYVELVCNAGVLSDGRWIRIYPVSFRGLPSEQRYKKYQWITLNLKRNEKDIRPESYKPTNGVDEPIFVGEAINTDNNWAIRKSFVLRNSFDSLSEMIALSQSVERLSLGVLQPQEIVRLIIEDDKRDWKAQWQDQLKQYDIFSITEQGEGQVREVVKKLPYKYSYELLSRGDNKSHTMMIEDWEIGALFWNCFKKTGSEGEANRMVRQKYEDEFTSNKDLYLFLGTTLRYHMGSPNPFVIIGVFYPPKTKQLSMSL